MTAWLAALTPRSAAGELTNRPRIVCEAPVFTFGTVTPAATVQHDFVVRNAGTAPLVISRVQASCGCIAAQPDATNLAPNATAHVHVTFALQGRQGHQKKSLRVWSNDTQDPYFQLVIEGDTEVTCGCDPPLLNFGTVSESAVVRTAVLSGFPATVHITNVVSESAVFLPEVGADHRQVQVRLQPPLPTGLVQSTVRVFTDAPSNGIIPLAVSYLVIPTIRVLPAILELPDDTTVPVTRSIWLRPGRVREFKVTAVSSSTPALQPLLRAIGPGLYCIDLKNIVVQPGLSGEHIEIVTDNPEAGTITVPVLIRSGSTSHRP